MTTIDLKFSPEMAKAALDGRKCCTSRRTPKGEPGDIFTIRGVRFRLLSWTPIPITTIVTALFRAEGFAGIEGCAAYLQAAYPDLNQYDSLCVHFFARVSA